MDGRSGVSFFELIAKGIGKVWSFITSTITITLIAGLVLFVLTVIMPDNMLTAIEIVRGLIG